MSGDLIASSRCQASVLSSADAEHQLSVTHVARWCSLLGPKFPASCRPELMRLTLCVQVHITLNKNSVPGDKSAMVPGGVRHWQPCNDDPRHGRV